jgi:hypothetical protein
MVDAVIELKERHAPGMSDILYMATGFGSGHLSAMDHPKALGDVVEAAIGAVLVDTDFDLAATFPVRFATAVHVCSGLVCMRWWTSQCAVVDTRQAHDQGCMMSICCRARASCR